MALIYDFLSEDDGLINHPVNGFLPRKAIIPLKKTDENDIKILVEEGATVSEGQTIAKSHDVSVHASIPGKVESIFVTTFPDGSEGYVAQIKLSGSFSYTGKKQPLVNWQNYDKNTICYMMADKGVVNTFSKTLPLAKLVKNPDSEILVVRLYSEDPSRVTDGFITSHYFEKIREGALITAKAMDAKALVFAYDINQNVQEAEKPTHAGLPVFFVGLDAKSYPCGFSHEIVRQVKNTLKDPLLRKLGNKDLFIDVQTALSVYEAIALGIPVMSRYVHVTGLCLNAAAVTKVKIGTTLSDLAQQCGSFKRKTAKIIINGIVTGNTLASFDVPVSKYVKSVVFMPQSQLPDQKQENCVRCGNCLKICPAGLFPESLYRCATKENEVDEHENLIKQTAVLCTECALCNSVCPSRLPLSQTISSLKIKNPPISVEEKADEK